MLSNAYFLAKFRFDTAENEPAKNLQNFRKILILSPEYRSPQLLRPDPEAAGLLGVIQDHLDCAISQPDALTLAAAVAVEVAGGPPLQVTFGRTKGPCKTIIDCAARGTCAPKLQVDLPRILRPSDS